ncbi:unnamed protein product [Rhizophagus irregularis]|uniref:Uncharacterized protein n=1 Tax=Rhizophagus irregularis TaxID=588596 RepID=A0A915ZM07_9GLOM|nr:unnamed protein product [Rhizophagus irregularis]
MEYEIENKDNLKKRCEEAMKIIPNYGDFTKNYFSIEKEKFSDTITQWQNSYPDLYYELEKWKEESGFTHETLTIIRKTKSKKVELQLYRLIYDSVRSKLEDTINCWQNSFPELREQLKGWRKSDVGKERERIPRIPRIP